MTPEETAGEAWLEMLRQQHAAQLLCTGLAAHSLEPLVTAIRAARDEGYRAGLEAGIDAANRQKAIYEKMMEGANRDEFAACEESMCACRMVAAAVARLKETP